MEEILRKLDEILEEIKVVKNINAELQLGNKKIKDMLKQSNMSINFVCDVLENLDE